MKHSWSLNILRAGILLVLLGFFLPVGCHLNGYQIAQGVIGQSQEAQNAGLLSPIPDAYGYSFIGVFVLAFAGLVLTFALKGARGYSLGSACLAVSFVLFIVVALKFLSIRNSAILDFVRTTFNTGVQLTIGGYSMGAGFLTAITGLVLRTTKTIQ
jgi:uncharacterized membrane protein